MDELRRAYHDRIADLHAQTVELVRTAAVCVAGVTTAYLEHDQQAVEALSTDVATGSGNVAVVEAEVIDLLAQQSPVARDLRMVLASLRIAQVGELCLGLVGTLAGRVGGGQDVLTESLRALFKQIGEATAELLERSGGAWEVIDAGLAASVIGQARDARAWHRRFMAELLGLRDVPVESAVDLGLVARAYERLTDHAVEIAGRVVFAATGEAP